MTSQKELLRIYSRKIERFNESNINNQFIDWILLTELTEQLLESSKLLFVGFNYFYYNIALIIIIYQTLLFKYLFNKSLSKEGKKKERKIWLEMEYNLTNFDDVF